MSIALDHLRLMTRNNAYANDRLFDVCCQLSEAELARERTSFFPSICETLNHIWEVDRYYLDALREGGKGTMMFDVPFLNSTQDLRVAQADVDSNLISFCDGLMAEDLTRKIAHDRGRKGVFLETVGNTLMHLFQHQIHHRGQVHAMLAGTDIAPPQLDEFFLEFDRHPNARKYF